VTLDSAEIAMQILQQSITGIRSRRKELGVEEKSLVKAKIAGTLNAPPILRKHSHIIEKLSRVSELEVVYFSDRNTGGKYEMLAWQSAGPVDIFVEYERTVDVAAERERLTRGVAKFEKVIASSDRQLNNSGFLAKAPAHIVEGLKKQRDEAKRLLDKARGDLDGLPEG
jgi:valyl-tRNA synthetase